MAKIKVGDIVYHKMDEHKSDPYVVLRNLHKGKYYVHHIRNGKEIDLYDYIIDEHDYNVEHCVKTRCSRMTIIQIDRRMNAIQWSYKIWGSLIDKISDGIHILRLNDGWGSIRYIKVDRAHVTNIVNMNDRKSTISYSVLKRVVLEGIELL